MSQSISFGSTPIALIIDDDAVFRVTVGDYLEEAGFDVQEAEDGHSGLAAFEKLCPDIILLDVMMPDMDGFTLCKKLRDSSESNNVPILMITGNDDIESVRYYCRHEPVNQLWFNTYSIDHRR